MSHVIIAGQIGPKESILSFNRCVPIGTEVECQGVRRRTWSWAGYGPKRVPSVWLDDDGPPVPLESLTIPGVVSTPQRRRSGETHGKNLGRNTPTYQPLYKE
jgi:hypothetical protein